MWEVRVFSFEVVVPLCSVFHVRLQVVLSRQTNRASVGAVFRQGLSPTHELLQSVSR